MIATFASASFRQIVLELERGGTGIPRYALIAEASIPEFGGGGIFLCVHRCGLEAWMNGIECTPGLQLMCQLDNQ